MPLERCGDGSSCSVAVKERADTQRIATADELLQWRELRCSAAEVLESNPIKQYTAMNDESGLAQLGTVYSIGTLHA